MRKTFTYLIMMAAMLIPALASAEAVAFDPLDGYCEEGLTEPAKGFVTEMPGIHFYVEGYWTNNEASDGFVTVKNQDDEVVFTIPAGSKLSQPNPFARGGEMEEAESYFTSIGLYFADIESGDYLTFPNGTYTITIPEGFFVNGTGHVNAELTFPNWYVLGTLAYMVLTPTFGEDQDQVTEPVTGKIENPADFTNMQMMVEGSWDVNPACNGLFTAKNEKGEVVFSTDAASELVQCFPAGSHDEEDSLVATNTHIGVMFVVDKEENTYLEWQEGVYSFCYPEGFFKRADGALSKELSFDNWYTIGEAEVPEPEVVELVYSTPEDGTSVIGAVSEVNLYFNCNMDIVKSEGYLIKDKDEWGNYSECEYTVSIPDDYKQMVTLTFAEPLTKGKYQTHYMQGSLAIGCPIKNIVKPVESNYSYPADFNYSFEIVDYTTTPAEGEEISNPISFFYVDLGNSSVTLEDNFELEVLYTPTPVESEDEGEAEAVAEGETEGEGEAEVETETYKYSADDVEASLLNWGTIEFDFDPYFTKAGTYRFTIPANSFKINDVLFEEEIQVTVTSLGFEATEVLSVTPACGEVENLSTITIEFNKDLVLSEYGEYENVYIRKGWSDIYYCSSEVSGSTVTLTILNEEDEPFTLDQPGTWTLESLLYKYAFADGTSTDFLEYDFEWSIPFNPETLVHYELYPADGATVKEISHVTVTVDTPLKPAVDYEYTDWDTGEKVTVYWEPFFKEYKGIESADDIIWSTEYTELPIVLSDDGKVLNYDYAEPIAEEGYVTYLLAWSHWDSVEGKYFPQEDNLLYWTVKVDPQTGVQLVGISSDAPMTVYDINGRVVLRNAKKVDVNTLQPGIYIANGMKFVVK